MSSAKRKAELRAAADAEERQRAISAIRDVEADVHYPGVGVPLLRLSLVQSFLPPSVWEIRDVGGKLVAYRSRGTEAGTRQVTGHAQVPVLEESLRAIVASLQGTTCTVSIAAPQFGVADADMYCASLFVNFETSIRLAWCAGYEPADWKPLVRILESFQALCAGFPDAV